MSVQVRQRRKTVAGRPAPCCPSLEASIDPRLFRALGDPTRIHILVRLARCCGPQTVTQAAADSSVDISVVSRHLAILRDAGIVTVRKEGRRTFCSVRYTEVARSLRALADAIEACCPDEKPGPTSR